MNDSTNDVALTSAKDILSRDLDGTLAERENWRKQCADIAKLRRDDLKKVIISNLAKAEVEEDYMYALVNCVKEGELLYVSAYFRS